MEEKNENQQAVELADMIDRLMSSGTGHVNVKLGDNGELNAHTVNSLDCSNGNMACGVPTLHKGIDDESDENDSDSD